MWPFLSGSNEILCGHVEGKNEKSVIKELQLFLENIKEKVKQQRKQEEIKQNNKYQNNSRQSQGRVT